MDQNRPLAPCLVGTGTLVDFRDMLRALETLEGVRYRYVVDDVVVSEGEAALVKLMADDQSSTLIVNGCLFLNVASFRYLDFFQNADGEWCFLLHGDGSQIELVSVPDAEEDASAPRPHLLSEDMAPDFDALISLDDDEDDD